jgi:hypothetical protein
MDVLKVKGKLFLYPLLRHIALLIPKLGIDRGKGQLHPQATLSLGKYHLLPIV